tara:strand:- start:74 stop:505 length:432 start_codon:yes stop_codon:yes gene_type:complete
MNKIETYGYAKELAYLHNWNYTTVVRTHYHLQPHIASDKAERIIKSGLASNVFITVEPDRDYTDRYTKVKRINHMHLLLHLPDYIKNYSIFRRDLASSIGVNKGAVLEVEPIRNAKQVTQYVTKHITMAGSHYDYFSNSTLNI